MIRLTNLADYAVVVMTAAARAADPRLSAGSVAAMTGLPTPTVAKLMSQLAKGGLLVSTRGVAGGFRLARTAAEITVADIVEAIDGPVQLTQCMSGTPGDCSLEGGCATRAHWPLINKSVRQALADVTLADIVGAPAETRETA
jgi:FeS assembly SUF system regulator